ncbi:hypothetical protein HT576_08690 [Haloterrigena sp. SYSU A121-1]|uniref:Uncharacterized protein n=1 Tax=Haloterrigena gelatinilytica TaxID=2741724 RepID=A0A8J8GK65_9EURY|nr:hypothetical protein [Haloterrigena gelatinilytica]NUB91096.1 hypothetical protein [Haloterrigena gelatinilytica]
MTENTADAYTIDSDAWLLIGTPVRSENENVITFHECVSDANIIRKQRPAFWYCDTEQEEPLFSRRPDPWDGNPRFEYVKDSSIDKQRVTNIPKQFFEDFNQYGSDEMNRRKRVDDEYLLEYEHLYYPVAPDACFAELSAAYLLPVETVVEIWSPQVAQTYTEEDIQDYGIDMTGGDSTPSQLGGEPS